jgi:hypothetical protein
MGAGAALSQLQELTRQVASLTQERDCLAARLTALEQYLAMLCKAYP